MLLSQLAMKIPMFDYLKPDWPAPDNVQAVITLRSRGDSCAPFDYFNLASHVGDDQRQVEANRKQLVEQLNLKKEPVWLNQIHGTTVINSPSSQSLPDVDGCFVDMGVPCVVLLQIVCLYYCVINRDKGSSSSRFSMARTLRRYYQ